MVSAHRQTANPAARALLRSADYFVTMGARSTQVRSARTDEVCEQSLTRWRQLQWLGEKAERREKRSDGYAQRIAKALINKIYFILSNLP